MTEPYRYLRYTPENGSILDDVTAIQTDEVETNNLILPTLERDETREEFLVRGASNVIKWRSIPAASATSYGHHYLTAPVTIPLPVVATYVPLGGTWASVTMVNFTATNGVWTMLALSSVIVVECSMAISQAVPQDAVYEIILFKNGSPVTGTGQTLSCTETNAHGNLSVHYVGPAINGDTFSIRIRNLTNTTSISIQRATQILTSL